MIPIRPPRGLSCKKERARSMCRNIHTKALRPNPMPLVPTRGHTPIHKTPGDTNTDGSTQSTRGRATCSCGTPRSGKHHDRSTFGNRSDARRDPPTSAVRSRCSSPWSQPARRSSSCSRFFVRHVDCARYACRSWYPAIGSPLPVPVAPWCRSTL